MFECNRSLQRLTAVHTYETSSSNSGSTLPHLARSCGCNSLHLHDTSFPLPKEVSNIEQAYKGGLLGVFLLQFCAGQGACLEAFFCIT